MNPKYYEAENCNRTFQHGDTVIRFRPWGTHGGCLCGVFCPETEQEMSAVQALAKDKKNLITEISRDDFDTRLNTLRIRQPLNITSADGTAGQRAQQRAKRQGTTVTTGPIRTDTGPAKAAMSKILSASEDEPVRPAEVKDPLSVDTILQATIVPPAAPADLKVK